MITIERDGADDLVFDLGRGIPTALGCGFHITSRATGAYLGDAGWQDAPHLFSPSNIGKGERTRLTVPAKPFERVASGEKLTIEIPAASFRGTFDWAPPSLVRAAPSTPSKPPGASPLPERATRRVDVLPSADAAPPRPEKLALAAGAFALAMAAAAIALGFWAMRVSASAETAERQRTENVARLEEIAKRSAAQAAEKADIERGRQALQADRRALAETSEAQRREHAAGLTQLARERHDFDRLRQNAGAEVRELEAGKRALADARSFLERDVRALDAGREELNAMRARLDADRAAFQQERDAFQRAATAAAPSPSLSAPPAAPVVAIAVDSLGRWEIGQQPTSLEARQEALRRCSYRGSGCQVNELQACVAFSRSARGWSYAFGATIDEARRLAAARCNQNFGSCAVLRDDEYCR